MKGEVNLFTRPRRFGKTLNMSMLRYFFETGEKDYAGLFQGLKIMDAGEEYLAHMGKYPVISVSLKSMKQYSYELAFEMLKKAIGEEYSRHWEVVEKSGKLSEEKQERFLRIRDLKGTEADYADSLKFLSECLYACTGQKSVIFIDEYDVPLENAYFSGFYDRMETISFYDYQESYYHGFLAGMLKNIGNYIVQSNRESGKGRPDIMKYGVAFYRKECMIKKAE